MIECFYSVNKKKTIQIIKDYRTRRDETRHHIYETTIIISYHLIIKIVVYDHDMMKENVMSCYFIKYDTFDYFYSNYITISYQLQKCNDIFQ